MIANLFLIAGVFALLGYANLRRRGGRTDGEEAAVEPTDNSINTQQKPAGLSLVGVAALVIIGGVALFAFYQSKSRNSPLTSTMTEEPKCVPPTGRELLSAYGGEFTFHREIDTTSDLAQKLFDRGLLHLYGYNQVEARRNFEAALIEDPSCAMCYWGVAYSHGPTINSSPTEVSYREGRAAIEKALHFSSTSSPVFSHLISAQSARFPATYEAWRDEGYTAYEEKYAKAMLLVYEQFPLDDDVAAMYAESIMNTSPWNYYEPQSNTRLNSKGTAAYNALSAIMTRNEWHPLALHLYIHIIESSSTPQRAELAADHLVQQSMHGYSGHLMHMPAHIYLRVGRYHDCIEASKLSIANDDLYTTRCMQPYLPGHNRGLLIACANFNGKMSTALEYSMPVRELPELAAVYISAVFPAPSELIYARYGQWRSIQKQQQEEEELFANQLSSLPPYFTVIRMYAKALAEVGTGNLNAAVKTQQALEKTTRAIPISSIPVTHPFYPHFQEMGAMMNYTVLAAIAGAGNDWKSAVKYLSTAAELQSHFSYMEPEVFYLPVKQCLGAAMLELFKQMGGDFSSVEDVFTEDLKVHPKNGFALRGLMQTLQAMGNTDDAAMWKLLHDKVWVADTEVLGVCCELNLC